MTDSSSSLIPHTAYGWSPEKRLVTVIACGLALVCGSIFAALMPGRIQTLRYVAQAERDWTGAEQEATLPVPTEAEQRAHELMKRCVSAYSTPQMQIERAARSDAGNAQSASGMRSPGGRQRGVLPLGGMDGMGNMGGMNTAESVKWGKLHELQRRLPFFNSDIGPDALELQPEEVRDYANELVAMNESLFPMLHEACAIPMRSTRPVDLRATPAAQHVRVLILLKALLDFDAGHQQAAYQNLVDLLLLVKQNDSRKTLLLSPEERLLLHRAACSFLQYALARETPGDDSLRALDAALSPIDERDNILCAALHGRFEAARQWARTPYPFMTSRFLSDLDSLAEAARTGTLRHLQRFGPRLAASDKGSALDIARNAATYGGCLEQECVIDSKLMAAARALVAAARYRTANGKWPDSLDALVPTYCPELPRDPASGDPLRYERDPAKGTVVVSVAGDAGRGHKPIRLEVHDRPVAATKES